MEHAYASHTPANNNTPVGRLLSTPSTGTLPCIGYPLLVWLSIHRLHDQLIQALHNPALVEILRPDIHRRVVGRRPLCRVASRIVHGVLRRADWDLDGPLVEQRRKHAVGVQPPRSCTQGARAAHPSAYEHAELHVAALQRSTVPAHDGGDARVHIVNTVSYNVF